MSLQCTHHSKAPQAPKPPKPPLLIMAGGLWCLSGRSMELRCRPGNHQAHAVDSAPDRESGVVVMPVRVDAWIARVVVVTEGEGELSVH